MPPKELEVMMVLQPSCSGSSSISSNFMTYPYMLIRYLMNGVRICFVPWNP